MVARNHSLLGGNTPKLVRNSDLDIGSLLETHIGQLFQVPPRLDHLWIEVHWSDGRWTNLELR